MLNFSVEKSAFSNQKGLAEPITEIQLRKNCKNVRLGDSKLLSSSMVTIF